MFYTNTPMIFEANMANSTEELWDEDLQLDDDFSVDDGDDFDMNGDIKPETPDADRSPVSLLGRSAVKAAKDNLLDPDNIDRLISDALPYEFNRTRSFLGDQVNVAEKVLTDAKTQLKKPTEKLKKQLREAKKLWNIKTPKFIDNLLEESEDRGYKSNYRDESQEQDDQILRTQAEIFKLNTEQNQEQRMEQQIQHTQLLKQGDQRSQLLDIVAQSTSRLANYQDQIGTKFQQKQLELSYRQFFALQNIYNETKQFREDSISHLSHIMKNTSLPDIVKSKSSEVMREMGLRRFIDMVQDGIGSKMGSYFRRFGNNMAKNIASRVSSLAEGISSGAEIVEQAADMKRTQDEMNEMTGEKSLSFKQSLANGVGGMAGGIAADHYRGRFSDWLISKLSGNKYIQRLKHESGNFMMNKEVWLSRLINSGFNEQNDDSYINKLPDFIKEPLIDLLRESNPSLGMGSGEVGFHNAKNLNDQALFDNRVHKSVTEVIPGYLARILQSSEGIRTGQVPEMLHFSHERDTFVGENTLRNDIKKKLMEGSEQFEENTKKVATQLAGEGNLSEEQMDQLQQFLAKRYRTGKHVTLDDFFGRGKFGKITATELDPDIVALIRKSMSDKVDIDEETGLLKNSEKTAKARFDFSTTNKRAYEYLPGIIERLRRAGEGGVGYTDILKELGYVQKDGMNSHSILTDDFINAFLAQGGIKPITNEAEAEEKVQEYYKKTLDQEQLNAVEADKQATNNKKRRNRNKNKGNNQTGGNRQDVQQQSTSSVSSAIPGISNISDAAPSVGTERIDILANVVNLKTESQGVSFAETALEKLSSKFQKYGESVKTGFDKLTGYLDPKYQKAKEKLQPHLDTIKEYKDKGLDWVKDQYEVNKLLAQGKFDEVQKFLTPYLDSAKDSFNEHKDKIQDQLKEYETKFKGKFTEYKDLFFASGEKALTEAKLKAGDYYDVVSQRVITSWDEITGEVVDLRSGLTVLTVNDIIGLTLDTGERAADLIKSIWDKRSQLPGFLANAKSHFGFRLGRLAEKAKSSELWAKVNGEMQRILDTETLSRVKLFDLETGKRILKLDDITTGIKDQYGNLICTVEELAEGAGLVVDGKFRPLSEIIPDIKNKASSLFEDAKNKGVSWWNSIKDFGTTQAEAIQARIEVFQKDKIEQEKTGRSSAFEEELLQLLREQFDFTNENLLEINQSINQLEITGVTAGFNGQQGESEGKTYKSLWAHVKDSSRNAVRRVGAVGKWVGNRIKNDFNRAKDAVSWVGDKAWSGAKVGGRFAKASIDRLSGDTRSDIYIRNDQGEFVLALEYRLMKQGAYFDIKGNAITSWDQLSSTIKDQEGNIVLNQDDIRKGLYNSKGKKLDTRLLGGLRDFLGTTMKREWARAGRLMGYLNPLKALGLAGTGISKLYGFGKRFRATDVYIRGEDHPRLFARAMKNGEYYDQNGKVIDNPTDISGEVRDREGNILITSEELSQYGICDAAGKPFKTVLGMIGGGLKKGASILWGELKRGGRAVKAIAKGAWDFVSAPFKAMFGSLGNATIDPYTRLTYELLAWKFGAPDEHKDEIKSIGGVKGRLKLFKEKVKEKYESTKKKLSALGNKMLFWELKNKEEDLKEAPENFKQRKKRKKKPIGTNDELDHEGKYKKGTWQRFFQDKNNKKDDASVKDKDKKKGGLLSKVGLIASTLMMGFSWLKGKLTDAFAWLPKIGGSLTDLSKWFKGGLPRLLTTLARDGIGGVGDMLSRDSIRKGGRGGFGRALGTIGKVAGVTSVAIGAYSMYDNIQQGNYGEAALDGALTAGSAALLVGGKGLAAAGGAIATGLAAVPAVGWAALALVGIAVGSYYLWQSFKGFDLVQKYKLASYGVDPEGDKDYAKKVLTLESLVFDATKFTKEGDPVIDMKDFPTWCAMFWNEEVDGDAPSKAEYGAHAEMFEYWWKHRFEPIYRKYAKIAKVIQPDAEFTDLEDDMDDKYLAPWAKRSFFTETDNRNPYTFAYLPFSDKERAETGPNEVKIYQQMLIEEYKSDEEKARKESLDAKRGNYTAWYNPFGASKDQANDFDWEKQFDPKAESFEGDAEGKMVSTSTTVESVSPDGTVVKLLVGETDLEKLNSTVVSDIQMIRFFFYGLKENNGTKDRVTLLRRLEAHMADYVNVSADGKTAVISDDYDFAKEFKRWGVEMGWDVSNILDQESWLKWFKTRFLVSYLTYFSKARNEVNGVQFENIDNVLKNDQLVTVAQAMMHKEIMWENNNRLLFTIPLSGFKGLEPNTDINTLQGPLKRIKEGAKQASLLSKPTKDEIELSRSKWQEMAKKDAALRDAVKGTDFSEAYKKAQDVFNTHGAAAQAAANGNAVPTYGSAAASNAMDSVGGTGVNQYSGTGDIKGITWTPDGKTFGGLKDVKQNWENLKDLIPQVAKFVGIDAGLLTRVAQVESGFSPTAGAKTSSAKGLYQFTNGTWGDITKRLQKLYGMTGLDVYNPVHNAIAGAQYIKDNMKAVKDAVSKAGRQPTAGAFYAAHFMGQGGMRQFYSALAKDPNAPATAGVATSSINANPGVFFKDHKNKQGLRTLAEVAAELERRTDMNGAKERAEWAQQQAGQTVTQQQDANHGFAQSNSPSTTAYDPTSNIVGGYVQPNQTVPQSNTTHTTVNQYDSQGNATTPLPSNTTTTNDSTQAQSNTAASEMINVGQVTNDQSGIAPKTQQPKGIVELMAKATPDLVALGKKHLVPLDNTVLLKGMNESFMTLLYASFGDYVKQSGNKHVFKITSAFRTFAQQAALYKQYGPGRATKPGNSKHESGVAIDIQSGAQGANYGPNADFNTGPLADWENKVGKSWGFVRPLRSGKHAENWHVENKHFPRKGAKNLDGNPTEPMQVPGTSPKQDNSVPYNGPIAPQNLSQPSAPTSTISNTPTPLQSAIGGTGNIMDYGFGAKVDPSKVVGLSGTLPRGSTPNPTLANQLPSPLNPAIYQQNPVSTGQSYRWLDIAFKEVGQVEVKGSGHNPRIQEYAKSTGLGGDDETPWCSSFVNWVMKQAGYKGTGSATALSWKSWNEGDLHAQPCYGSIAVFSYGGGKGHVGFVVGKKGDKLAILGGNQSDSVRVSGFNKGKIIGYVLPKGITPNFNIPDYTGPMNVYNSVADEMSQTRGPVSNAPTPLASGGGTTPAPYAQQVASPEVQPQVPTSPNVVATTEYNPVTGLPQTVNTTTSNPQATGSIMDYGVPQAQLPQGMGTNPNIEYQARIAKESLQETNSILKQSLDVQKEMSSTLKAILGIIDKKPSAPLVTGKETNPNLLNQGGNASTPTPTAGTQKLPNTLSPIDPSGLAFSGSRPSAIL